jgi:non-homologous end joining protein Ku
VVGPSNIINLMEALQKSVSQTKKPATKTKKTTKSKDNITTLSKRA